MPAAAIPDLQAGRADAEIHVDERLRVQRRRQRHQRPHRAPAQDVGKSQNAYSPHRRRCGIHKHGNDSLMLFAQNPTARSSLIPDPLT